MLYLTRILILSSLSHGSFHVLPRWLGSPQSCGISSRQQSWPRPYYWTTSRGKGRTYIAMRWRCTLQSMSLSCLWNVACFRLGVLLRLLCTLKSQACRIGHRRLQSCEGLSHGRTCRWPHRPLWIVASWKGAPAQSAARIWQSPSRLPRWSF